METLNQLADAIRQHNDAHKRVAAIIGRPPTPEALGRYVACRVLHIELDPSGDGGMGVGRFCDGPLAGDTVAVRWRAQGEHALDIDPGSIPDYYLVMAGSGAAPPANGHGELTWPVGRVYLFDAAELVAHLAARGHKAGPATFLVREQWRSAEIYPRQRCTRYILSGAQRYGLGRLVTDRSFG
jgi:hypothetical protein